jgi:hypothetical protein
MCLDSAHYDTCVFLCSLNEDHSESAACVRLLDVSRITWAISFSALSLEEATASEYIQQFEIECVSNGVDISKVPLRESQTTSQKHVAEKKRLRQHGFVGNDWMQLMAAVASRSSVLLTTDADFWDPRNKAQPGAKRRLDGVKRAIESSFGVAIRLPSEALDRCGEC